MSDDSDGTHEGAGVGRCAVGDERPDPAPSERFHGLRWRWRYYVVWRLIGRKGPL